MAQRIKLGLVFKYDESWVAGSYYTLNLLHALKTLPSEKQPQIILFCDSIDDQKKIEQIAYPYISFKKYLPKQATWQKVINKVSRAITGNNWFETRMKDNDLDYIFIQRRSWETDLLSNSKKIFWIPDCQELMMPELFFKRELEGRKHVYNEIITAGSKILFSSQTAMNHFKSFYPMAVNPMFVVNFAVVHPLFNQISIEQLLTKYTIEVPYFMAPNQFWVHKNHKIVLEAVLLLKKEHFEFKIVFTGKENDFRAPEYTNELKQFVLDHDLGKHVAFLGFIPREEQLCLMKNSLAIIQPSLFEGWSTVVEDAKAIEKWIILSDIPVHQEQIQENVDFFDPNQASTLAEVIKIHVANPKKSGNLDYNQNLIRFGEGFHQLLIK